MQTMPSAKKPAAAERRAAPAAIPFWPPILPLIPIASGLYRRYGGPLPQPIPVPEPVPIPWPPQPVPSPVPGRIDGVAGETDGAASEALVPPILPVFEKEELRLDVDSRYPLQVASGTLYQGFKYRVHWIANLEPIGANTWSGTIWYKDGDTAFAPSPTPSSSAPGSASRSKAGSRPAPACAARSPTKATST
jgi:hypothetical protein